MRQSALHVLTLLVVAVVCLLAPPVAQAAEVRVFAAASLKTALDQLRMPYETQSGNRLVLTYAGSSVLARQLAQGAPADVYISANALWMDNLQERGVVAAGSRFDLVGNSLVLVSSEAGETLTLERFAQTNGRIAMGLVKAVPAGIYGKEALENADLWGAVSGRVVQVDNVRAALALVARGEVAFGVVYRSDAMAEPRAHLRHVFDEAAHTPIVYPVGLLQSASDASAGFVRFLQDDAAQKLFEELGFQRLEVRE